MLERFTDRARTVMQLANQEAHRFRHEYIGTEHILLGLIQEGSGVAANVLKNLDVSPLKVRQEIETIVQSGPEKTTMGKLPQTPRAKRVIEFAIAESRNLGHNYVGTEHLLLGLLREEEGLAAQVLMNLGLNLDAVRLEVRDLLGVDLVGVGEQPEPPRRVIPSALDAHGRDLTEMAHWNKLDPVVGRGDEIERILLILGRRTRNNPLLVGEPGVGKTALVHGLAQRLAAEGGSRSIRFRRIVALDALGCPAGGEGYESLRKEIALIVAEFRTAKDVLLFLDDLPRWDPIPYALAPLIAALMHGTIQCVAVVSELRQPLPCFEPIRVEALSPSATLPVLAALRGRYAEHHRVAIADEAIQAVVELPYDPIDRRLPGIAVDVLDEACALVRLRAGPPPAVPELAEFDARIARLNREKEHAVLIQDFERAATCHAEMDALKGERQRRARETGPPADGVVDAAVVAEVARLRGLSTKAF